MSSKIILREDVKGLGKRGDIVDVADGYARNYLVPRNLAMSAAAGTVAQAASMRRARDLRDAKDRAAAETIARELVSKTVTMSAKSHGERLFGSISSADVAVALNAQTGINLDKKQINLVEPIKTLGSHDVSIRLHSDVQFTVNVNVVPA
jgi:large subunit ribosomal protein L9